MKKGDDNPFAKLASLRDQLPRGAQSGAQAEPAAKPSPYAGKIVVRKERAGRGGKTVTMIEGVAANAVDDVAREMKKALGCGAVVEDGAIVLQGEQEDRAQAFLQKKGATKIVMGTKR